MRHRLSGSRTELAEHCMYWARPDVALGPGGAFSVAARLGSALHQGAETAAAPDALALSATGEDAEVDEEELEDALAMLTARPLVDLADIAVQWGLTPSAEAQLFGLFSAWREWWTPFLAGREHRREVPFAWDTATWSARVLPSRHARDYSAALPTEVTCTADAVIYEPGIVTVVDLKTGRAKHRRASDHAQLATGALCAARVAGVDRARVVLAAVREGEVYADVAELDGWALDGRAALLEAQLAELPTAEPRPGLHCARLYCPALAVCEGPRRLALAAPALAQALTVEIRSELEAATALAAAKPLQAFVDALKRAAVEWAETHGNRVTMPDGLVMRRVEVGRRSLDVANPRLIAELERTLGAEGVKAATKVKTSIAVGTVEKAVKATAKRGEKEKAVAAVMTALEATGGVKQSFHREWQEQE